MTDQNTKGRIASGFYRVIEHLGGMSDILAIAGSYGDTLTDEQVADELEAWLDVDPTCPQPSGETREATDHPSPSLSVDLAELKRLAEAAEADNANPNYFEAARSLQSFNEAANPSVFLSLIAEIERRATPPSDPRLDRAIEALEAARWYVVDHQESQPNDETRSLLTVIDEVLK